MVTARLARMSGTAALICGLAWVVAVVVHSLQPPGCVGDQCLMRPEREAAPVMPWLAAVAAVALVVFLLSLLALLARTRQLGRTGVIGVVLCGLGLAALTVISLSSLSERVRPLPFLLALAVGLALLGWTLLRSDVVPTWAGVGLLVGVLLLVGSNEEDARVLLALPAGLALLATGVALLRSGSARGRMRQPPGGASPLSSHTSAPWTQ